MNIHEKINYRSWLSKYHFRFKIKPLEHGDVIDFSYPMFTATWIKFYTKKDRFECKF